MGLQARRRREISHISHKDYSHSTHLEDGVTLCRLGVFGAVAADPARLFGVRARPPVGVVAGAAFAAAPPGAEGVQAIL